MDTLSEAKGNIEFLPSERKICSELGVSRDTVRKAIASLVSEGILEPRHGQGTIINKKNINRHIGKINWNGVTIGIILNDGKVRQHPDAYCWGVMCAAINELSAKGIGIQFIIIESTGLAAAREIISKNINGLIWLGPGKDQLELINILRDKGMDIVTIGGTLFESRTLNYIGGDDFAGGVTAANCLLDKGHKRILFVSKVKERTFTIQRFKGYQKGIDEHNLSMDKSLIIEELELSNVYKAVRKSIQNRKHPFSAIFCADGIFLSAIQSALKDENCDVPGTYSLITYDIPSQIECMHYKPDYLNQDLVRYGKIAAKSMEEIISGSNKTPVRELIPPVIVKGNSIKVLNQESGDVQ